MFLFTNCFSRTGTVEYENDSTSGNTSSGLKAFGSPAYLTGTSKFLITKRKERFIPSKEGISKIDELIIQFGWDQIKSLQDTGIKLEPGRFKLNFDNETYRLVSLDDFGQDYARNYLPLGIIECKFYKETRHAY